MAKKRFKSYADAELAFERAEENANQATRALMGMLADGVKWFKRGAYKAGVCYPTSMSGGTVIVVYRRKGQADQVDAANAERWASETIQRMSPLGYGDEEINDLRELAGDVQRYVRESNKMEVVLCPLCDQDVHGPNTCCPNAPKAEITT